MNQDLLQPSLAGDWKPEAIYSVRALFLVTFFGGPFAIALMAYIQSKFLNRRNLDLILILGFILISSACYVGVGFASQSINAPEWLGNARFVRIGMRVFSLAFFGLLYLRWKPMFKAFDVSSMGHKNPWPAAIPSLILGMAVPVVLVIAGVFFAKL